MRTTQVTCDQCGKDLTHTGNCEDFRIVLADEAIPSRGGAVTAMAIRPPLGGARHFCGMICLRKWVAGTEPDMRQAVTAAPPSPALRPHPPAHKA